MARKFNPKSQILKRYFKEAPFGLKEVNARLTLPIYEEETDKQYQIIIMLLLINKRQEILNRFMALDNLDWAITFSYLETSNYKTMISMIRGISDRKREIVLNYILENRTPYTRQRFKDFVETLLKSKDRDLKFTERTSAPSKVEEEIFKNRSKIKSIPNIKGTKGNISFSMLGNNDRRALYLDDYSDCCQGLDKAGEGCMIDGIENPDSSFLVFERRGVIFAQGWIRKINKDTLLIDSIEFKGDFNPSLTSAITEAVNGLNCHFKHIFMGLSPNRGHVNNFYKNSPMFYKRDENRFPESKAVFDLVNKSRIYSDAKNNILKLR